MVGTADGGKAEEKSEQKAEVLFEDVLERCCGTGRWQTLLIGYMSVMWLLFPVFSMSMMFVGATPKFKCSDGFAANATFRWAFDPSVYVSTVVTEWTLVCGRKPLLSLLQSWLMIGGLFGSVVSGHFAAVRFLTGVAMSAMISSQYVLMMELCSSERRAAIGLVSLMPFAFGTCLVALGSYLIRTRWLLQLAYAVPCLIFLFNFWLMPESPRWLVLQDRFPEACAEEVLQLMAEARNNMLSRQTTMKTAGGYSPLQMMLQLVRTPHMRRRTLIAVFLGFIIAGSYFGISFDTTQLAASPHLAAVFSGLADIPSSLVFPLLDRLGRRRSLILLLSVQAAAMLLTFVQKDTTLWLVLGVVAKIGVSSAFNTIMVFVAELMPTEVRSLACGLRQLAERAGAALAPFVVDLVSELHESAPSAVFAGLALLGGLAGLLLPETNGRPMPETVADVDGQPVFAAPTAERTRTNEACQGADDP
ncbi:organic cation transporter protein-like [Pollicipes pollicipes]|uniref:organic cation transporter protein-like n=1 Tax=Pollicipes pollicipes TaxID=41117 RepID=UPI00188552A2|nr:organic cation transporter protein-like [Pollicipes pollicipes]